MRVDDGRGNWVELRIVGHQLPDFDWRRDMLLRAFCHAYGDKVILLLAAYDKSEDPSAKRQQKEIELARRRLADWQRRQRRS